jgi:hypothetical protein
MTLLPRLEAGFYLVVAGLVSGHPRPVCRCGATAFQHLPLPFLRTKEAALFIGVSCGTLEKHRSYGTGPNDRGIGRRIIYVVTDLREWAERGARRATSDPGGTTILPAKSNDTVSQMEPIPDGATGVDRDAAGESAILGTPAVARLVGVSPRRTGPNYSEFSGRAFYAIGDLTGWANRGARRSTSDPARQPSWAHYQPIDVPPGWRVVCDDGSFFPAPTRRQGISARPA